MKKIWLLLTIPFFTLSQQDCEQICLNKVHKDAYWTQATYTGCVDKFGTPSGRGKQEFNSIKQIYDGCWKEGVQHGLGRLETNSWIYEGDFENGQQHGYGKLIYLNNNKTWRAVYEGDFENGQQHGYGKITYIETGEIWQGRWEYGERTEEGYYNYENIYNIDDFISDKNQVTIQLDKNPRNSHCYIDVKFGNISQLFLYDTGCSEILINPKFFKKLQDNNVTFNNIDYSSELSTATGEKVSVDYYSVDRITINSDLEIKNIIVAVCKNDCELLFGESFNNKFSTINTFINAI